MEDVPPSPIRRVAQVQQLGTLHVFNVAVLPTAQGYQRVLPNSFGAEQQAIAQAHVSQIEGANASTPPNVPVAHTHPHEHGGMKGEMMLQMILPSLLSPNQFLIPARGCNDKGSP
jgi:hypothetical protein